MSDQTDYQVIQSVSPLTVILPQYPRATYNGVDVIIVDCMVMANGSKNVYIETVDGSQSLVYAGQWVGGVGYQDFKVSEMWVALESVKLSMAGISANGHDESDANDNLAAGEVISHE